MTATESPTLHQLLAQWERLLRRYANRAARHYGLDREDAYQAIIAIVIARFPTHNPARATFQTWLKYPAREAISHLLQDRQRSVRGVSLSIPCRGARDRGGENAELAELVPASKNSPDPTEEAARREEVERLRACVAMLSPEHQAAIRRRFFGDGNGFAVRADLDLVTEAIQRLREALTLEVAG